MRSYQFLTIEDSIDTQYTILVTKIYFAEDEDSKILKAWPLTKGMTPPLRVCQAIMEKYGLARTA